MNENEDGTGSPTSSSFLIQIPSLTSNKLNAHFNIKNTKIGNKAKMFPFVASFFIK